VNWWAESAGSGLMELVEFDGEEARICEEERNPEGGNSTAAPLLPNTFRLYRRRADARSRARLGGAGHAELEARPAVRSSYR
jgi:hypothetical protein